MSLVTFNGVGISGISAAVPKKVIDNRQFTNVLTKQEIENTIKTTGIYQRRFASKNICSSDLCYFAAQNLIENMNIKKDSVDLLIFVSQTPDYHQPATAPILQHRLKLSKTTGAFDLNLACSGYVYGLATAYSFASQKDINRILLLVGETLSKIISKNDRATSLLFGDGGSATLIEKNKKFGPSYFSMNSDGSGDWVLRISGGGYRIPSSIETLKERKYEDGSIRSDEHLFMDGMEVFNFTMREVPKDIIRLLKYSEFSLEEIDYIIFHQANKFMIDFFVKKLNYPTERVPYSLNKFGNTSAVSIPLTIVSELKNDLISFTRTMLFSGYGGGLSWSTALTTLSKCYISDLLEI
jgi:3-oxoacyl-[acyl-carrier-protein] synthase-3